MKGTKGQLRVIESLKYLENGSASPMETVLVMLLTLPYRLGGYGLPLPKINARINPSKAARRSMSQAFYVCDLFWPDLNVAVEYDSDMFHNRTVQVDKDSRKRNSLAALGIVTITVTSQQVMSVTALERVANQLAINMGRRLQQNSNPQFGKAHQELRRKLLDFQY
ncbi:MAG: hypothetical protein LBU61_02865 [Coriobacteriales bacterium]|nr:hypothetical protein [Coriobacteriales bacterium]